MTIGKLKIYLFAFSFFYIFWKIIKSRVKSSSLWVSSQFSYLEILKYYLKTVFQEFKSIFKLCKCWNLPQISKIDCMYFSGCMYWNFPQRHENWLEKQTLTFQVIFSWLFMKFRSKTLKIDFNAVFSAFNQFSNFIKMWEFQEFKSIFGLASLDICLKNWKIDLRDKL